MSRKLNRVSARITEAKAQGASQAMLHATGSRAEDLHKPQLGISAMWYDGNPCNMHLGLLADAVQEGARAAGLVAFRFFTIGVSDGISMGTEGMSYSLQSRDLIADSIETVMSAQWYDANVSIPGCDKNMPGCLMAMGRLNRPALMVYGGTIEAGRNRRGEPIDIIAAFQSYGESLAERISEDERARRDPPRVPGRGRLRRHVHREHDGVGDRGARHVAALQRVDARRRAREARGVSARGRGGAEAARARSQAARHHDARGLRERDGGGHRARRLDQPGAAPDRDGALGRPAARRSTTSSA